MTYTRTRTLLAIVGASTLWYILGCGPGGQVMPHVTNRVVRASEQCLRENDGKCFMLHVQNDGYYRVTVSVNGWKAGEVEGNHSDAFPVPESKLRDGRCATVAFWVIGPAARLSSDKQCIREGGYFVVQLDVLYHVFLTPWGGR